MNDAGQNAQLRRRQLVELADGRLRRRQVERRLLHEHGCDRTVVGTDLSPRACSQRQDMGYVVVAVTPGERHRVPSRAYIATVPRGRAEYLMQTLRRSCIMGRQLVDVAAQQHSLRQPRVATRFGTYDLSARMH